MHFKSNSDVLNSSFISFVYLIFCVNTAKALWPLPRNYTHGASTVWLSQDVAIYVTDQRVAAGTDWRIWNLKPLHWLGRSFQTILYDIYDPKPVIVTRIMRALSIFSLEWAIDQS